MRIFLGLLPLAVATLGCRVYSVGLATENTVGDSARMDHLDSGGVGEHPPIDGLGGPAIDSDAYQEEVGEALDVAPEIGVPSIVGCSDGTREGFRDRKNWPRIAGCAGGWLWPGLLDESGPLCNREAGNDSQRPDGRGCSVFDLCALTWHPCHDGPEVTSHSPTGCESAVSPGDEAFFVVRAGASNQGVCYPDPSAENDLHGCGSIGIGQSESSSCSPLDRRMSFADCAATNVWWCGTAQDSLHEAAMVSKLGSSLGGVLCCKDD